MKSHLSCAALAVAIATFAEGSASAQEVDVAFNVAYTTDYVFRGYSQNNEDPALQGGVDVGYGDWYIGLWASDVDFGNGTDAEIDLYGGYRTEMAGFVFDVGVLGYGYTNEPSAADSSYVELKLAASRAIGPVTVGLAFYPTPDFFGTDEEAVYSEANAAFIPADGWTISGAVGRQALDVSPDYTSWNAGVSWAFTPNLIADVRYHDTDVDGTTFADDRIVGTIKALF